MKKSTITAIAASCGAVIFAGAAIANYTTADGYEVVKNSVLGFRGMTNYTIDFSVDVQDMNSNEITTYVHTEVDEQGNKSYTLDGVSGSFNGETTGYKNQNWDDGYKSVRQTEDEKPWGYEYGGYSEISNPMTGDIFGDKDSTEKIINFMSAALDTVTGDLKNNFTYMGTEDGVKSYRLSLDAIQIPEVVNAGISAMTSVLRAENEGYVSQDEEDKFTENIVSMKDAYTKSVTGDFKINEDGTYNDGELKAVIAGTAENGDANEYTVTFKLALSDVGSTVPQDGPTEYRNLVTDDTEDGE